MNKAMLEYLRAVADSTSFLEPRTRSSTVKQKAAVYLGKNSSALSPTDHKRLRAKANKIKTSQRKEIRRRGSLLSKQASWYSD